MRTKPSMPACAAALFQRKHSTHGKLTPADGWTKIREPGASVEKYIAWRKKDIRKWEAKELH